MASLFGSMYSGGGGGFGEWGGGVGSLPMNKPKQQESPSGIERLYNSGTEQNAQDYGDIMQGYRNLLASSANSPMLKPSGSYNPLTYEYNPTANAAASLSNLKNLTQTGGIEDSEAADIRERGISPIRSIYSSANRDIDRNRSLRGGYSPGYQATKAKMARELSNLISGKITDVNADIAEKRQQGRLSSSNVYASASGAENALAAQYGSRNTDTLNEAQKFNLMLPLEFGKYNQGQNAQSADILRGMTSLYGTTPAISALYGGQALNQAQLQNLMNNQNAQFIFGGYR